jgi:phosphate transport system permease protein
MRPTTSTAALPGLFARGHVADGAGDRGATSRSAIALFLSELAPRRCLAASVGATVETLAAVPSVVLGLWGILVLGRSRPTTSSRAARHSRFIPLFSGTPQSSGSLHRRLVLAIMVVPIVASICRELFLSVPDELEEGALALGATRWEMVRASSSRRRGRDRGGVILGLGRAIGEAIAVTQVIGAGWTIQWSLFSTGDTLASRIAGQYQGARLEDADLVALLPRRDPARDRAASRTCRAADRAAVRASADGGD